MAIQNMFKANALLLTAALALTTVANAQENTNTAQSAEPTTTSDIWHDAKLYTDTSSLDEKIQRFSTDSEYRTAVNALSSRNSEDGITAYLSNAATKMPERYIVFWDAHLNRDMDLKSVLSFGGMSATDASDTTHNKNMEHVIDCREEILDNTPPPSRLLQFMQIRNCAGEKITAANVTYKADYTFLLENTYIDPANLRDKLETYETSRNNGEEGGGLYYQNVKEHARIHLDNDSFADMYFKSAIPLWHTMLDPNTTWDDIKDTPDEDDNNKPELLLSTPTDTYLDNNVQFLFDCRDALVSSPVTNDLKERVTLYNNVLECWTEKTNAAHNALKASITARSANIHADTTPYKTKIAQLKSTDTIYKPYQTARDTQGKADYDHGDMHLTSWTDDVLMWHAHLDTSMPMSQLLESSDEFKQATENSYYINENLDTLYQCRGDILGTTALDQITNPSKAFNDVHSCAAAKVKVPYDQWQADLAEITADPYVTWEDVPHYRLLKQAHTDISITFEDLDKTKMHAENEEHPTLSYNFNSVLECRDDAVQAGQILEYSTIHECAGQKALSAYTAFEAKEAQERKELYTNVTIGVVGFGMTVGLGVGGAVAYRRKKRQPPKLTGNN